MGTNKTPIIEITSDYSRFHLIKGNREIKTSHVKRLKDEIVQNPSLTKYTPLLVTRDMGIEDGQHRYRANEALDLPIYYIVTDEMDLDVIKRLQANNKAWTPQDYAESFATLGNRNYVQYLDFKESSKLNHDVLQQFLSLDDPITTESFKGGKLKVSDTKRTSDLISKLKEVGQYFKSWKRRGFAFAFRQMWEHSRYDHKHFVAQMKLHGATMPDLSLTDEYLVVMQEIYNDRLSKVKQISFSSPSA